LGLIAPAQVGGVEELLETLILPSPVSDVRVVGTVPLRPGVTYRIVATGITTITTNQGIQLFDPLYFFSPVGPSGPQRFPQHVELTVGVTSLGGLAPPDLPFPPFNPDHRYERVFAATPFINGLLGTRLTDFSSPGTTTIKVELFGNREELACNEAPATIEVTPGAPTFGTPGNDVIVGTEIDDQIFGRGGFDIICGFGGNDRILGNQGRDFLFGGPGNDILIGGNDDSDDFLFGEGDQDILRGGGGDDVLDGGLGIDRMIGGRGDDRLFVNGPALVSIIDGTVTRQGDFLNGGSGDNRADYSQLPGPVTVNLRKDKQLGGETLKNIEEIRGRRRSADRRRKWQ
jgi:hypothetical protein